MRADFFYFTGVHFFFLRDSANFSLIVREMFCIVFSDSLSISLVSKLLVWIRRFILAYDGWGILYPANSTSELPLSTTRNKLPNVWSSLLKTYVAQRMSFGYYSLQKSYLVNDQLLLKLRLIVAVLLTYAWYLRGNVLLILFGHVAVVIALGHLWMGILSLGRVIIIIVQLFVYLSFCVIGVIIFILIESSSFIQWLTLF